ncbi:MAG: hypothetical protein IT233_10895 [Bacteroidia bacterium]|nr:hypothetical protein [Bacteroidia bacterium]
MRHLLLLSVILILFIFPSCSGESEDNANSPADSTAQAGPFNDSTGYRNPKYFFKSLPSPLAMAAVFHSSGLPYIDGVCHDPKRASNYTLHKTKAINLGIYSADLAYQVVNDQPQYALAYLDAIKRLSDELGIKTAFNTEGYIHRFRNNVGKKDSLAFLVAELKQEMDTFLSSNERENTALFIFCGSWIECIYIATRSIESKPNEVIANTIAEQKYLLDNLVELLTGYEKEPNFKDLFDAMNDLKASFDQTVSSVGEGVSVTEVNESSLKEISRKVSDIRKHLITL